jgi:protein-arginine kinase activator protein McsA
MNEFDDLFNDFMGEINSGKKPNEDISDELKKILDILKNPQSIEDAFSEEMDKPDEIITYEENGSYFKKMIWKLEHGQLIKTIVSDIPFEEEKKKTPKKRIPLEIQLANAINEENYELAAKLRDKINKKIK